MPDRVRASACGALLGGCSLPASENTEHAADAAQVTAAQTDAELV